MRTSQYNFLKERIEEILSKKLLTEEVKLVFWGEITNASINGDISIKESDELELLLKFDRAKHKETVDIVLMGEIINL